MPNRLGAQHVGITLGLVLGAATLACALALPASAGHGNKELHIASGEKNRQQGVVRCFHTAGWSTGRLDADLLITRWQGLTWSIAFTRSTVAYVFWDGRGSPSRADWRTVERCLAA
jgi:hypothetical protein